jgi:hypothetical protein
VAAGAQSEPADPGFRAHPHPGPRFTGFSSDTTLGVGPNHFVTAVNLRIRFFTKAGELTYDADIHDFFGQFAQRPTSYFSSQPQIYDPAVLYDPHSQRFVVSCLYTDQSLLVAVSDDADPNGSWIFGRQDTSSYNSFTDFPNLGFDSKAFYVVPQFVNPPSSVWAFVIDKSALAGPNPQVRFVARQVDDNQNTLNSGTRVYDADAPYYWVRYRRPNRNPFLLQAITGSPGDPVVHRVELPVPAWSFQTTVLQGGTFERLRVVTAQPIRNSVFRNGSLWFAHGVQPDPALDQIVVRWYEVKMNGWPLTGGTPELAQAGDINLGSTTGGNLVSSYIANLEVDQQNNVAFVFSASASDMKVTIYRAFRAAGDPLGTVRGVKEWHRSTSHGTTVYSDYSGMQIDPADPSWVWGHAEYFVDTWEWETWLGGFNLREASGGTSGGEPEIAADPERIDFDLVPVGGSELREVEVTNAGGEDLEIRRIALRGRLSEPFRLPAELDGCSGKTLPPGDSCRFSVGFEPTEEGTWRAKVWIRSSDPERRRLRIVLRGRGL